MAYLLGREGAWAIVKSTNGVHGYPKTKQLNFWLKLNGRNEKMCETHCSMYVTYFTRSI